MKRMIAILMAMVMVMQVALAQSVVTTMSTVELPEQALKPGDAFYGLDRAMERIQLAFTFQQEKKAELRLKFAQERLAELDQLEEEKDAEIEKHRIELMNEYNKEMEEARQEALKIKNRAMRAEFDDTLEGASEYHVQVLERVRTRLMEDDNPNNDNALNGLDNAIENAEEIRIEARERVREYHEDFPEIEDEDEDVNDDDSSGQNGRRS